MLLVGTHERRLDDKSRLSLPAQFRDHFGDQCYLTRGRKNCVEIVTTEQFERISADLLEQVRSNQITENKLMAIAAGAVLTSIDKQGRVVVDEKLRAYANVTPEQQVILSGRLDRFQLWAPDRFEQLDADGTAEMAFDL